METYGYLTADATTGFILGIRYPTGPLPIVGVTEDGLYRNVILTSANLPNEQCKDWAYFTMNYYYHEPTGTFINTGPRPNDYANWNFTTNSWDWDPEVVLQDIRMVRNALLKDCDWMLLPDTGFTEAQIVDIKAYRQQLRDFPATVTNNPATKNDVTYPSFPF